MKATMMGRLKTTCWTRILLLLALIAAAPSAVLATAEVNDEVPGATLALEAPSDADTASEEEGEPGIRVGEAQPGRAGFLGLSQTSGPSLSVEGWITSVSEVSAETLRLVCLSANGRFELDVSAASEIRAEDGKVMAASELSAGQRIEAAGLVSADARVAVKSAVVAEAPETAPPTAPEVEARGRVRAAVEGSAGTDGRDLVVMTTARGEMTVEADASTVILAADGSGMTFAELESGQALNVEARGTTEVVVRAERIQVLPPGRPSRLQVEGRLKARAQAESGGERWIVGETSLLVEGAVDGSAEVSVGDEISVNAERGEGGNIEASAVAVLEVELSTVEIRGTVESESETAIVIDGIRVSIDGDTEVEGDVELGSFVSVRASMEGSGELQAETIEVQLGAEVTVQFEGEIEAMSLLEWTVEGVECQVDLLATVITGLAPIVGLHAEVTGTLNEDGSVEATRIHVEADALAGLERFEGRLISVGEVPGTWRFEAELAGGANATYDLLVTADTIVDEARGAARAGASAQVTASVVAEGELDAALIRIR